MSVFQLSCLLLLSNEDQGTWTSCFLWSRSNHSKAMNIKCGMPITKTSNLKCCVHQGVYIESGSLHLNEMKPIFCSLLLKYDNSDILIYCHARQSIHLNICSRGDGIINKLAWENKITFTDVSANVLNCSYTSFAIVHQSCHRYSLGFYSPDSIHLL